MSSFDASAAGFTPTSVQIDPPNRPDQLAEAVLASLSRGRWGYRGRPAGLIKTIIVSVLTMGLWPLLVWPRRFADFMKVEQQQLIMLADWLKLRTGRGEADDLRQVAMNRIGPGNHTEPLHGIIIALAAFFLVSALLSHNLDFPLLWQTTWDGYGRHSYHAFFGLWTILLSVGYLGYYLTVCHHAGALDEYVERFNAITAREGVPAVRAPRLGVGIEPLWIVAGVIGMLRGNLWAVPLALGGVVQSRYVMVVSRQARAELGRRVGIMLRSSRPALDLRSTPRPPSTQCVNEKCRAPVRLGSAFCPRCGARSA